MNTQESTAKHSTSIKNQIVPSEEAIRKITTTTTLKTRLEKKEI